MATNNHGPIGAVTPVTTTTANLGIEPATKAPVSSGEVYPQGGPAPEGTQPGEEGRDQTGTNTDPTAGVGVDGELVVWIGRYSMKNFIGRSLLLAVGTGLWLWLADYTWRKGHPGLGLMTTIIGGIVIVFWLIMGWRMIQARYSHYYRLTTRRLFVSSGMFSRRRDMMELLKLKDVYTRQPGLMQRMLGLGTVIAESTEHGTPTFFMPGVNEPKQVMDLIWHHARAERDQRSMKVESI